MKIAPRFGYFEVRAYPPSGKDKAAHNSLLVSTEQDIPYLNRFYKAGDVVLTSDRSKTPIILKNVPTLKRLVQALENKLDQAYLNYRQANKVTGQTPVAQTRDGFQAVSMKIAQQDMPAILDELQRITQRKRTPKVVKAALTPEHFQAFRQSVQNIVPGELGRLEEKDWTLPDLGIFTKAVGTTLWQRPLVKQTADAASQSLQNA